jgi:DNA polymerase-3 subunit delta
MEVTQFETEISSPERKPFYLVAGGEPSATRCCLEAARKAVSPAMFQLNYRQYHVEELNKTSWKRLGQDLLANPFGQPPKIVVLLLTENEKLTAENLETISKLRPRIIGNATLVLILEGTPDARLKFYKEVAKEGLEVDCRIPDRHGLPKWLMERLRERGLSASPDVARAMIDRIGPNPGVLLSEADKLALYPGTQGSLSLSHIRSFVSLGPTAEIYELGNPLGQGRLEKAIPTLLDLLEKNDPMPLIYAVGTHFRRLLRMAVILEANGGRASDEELAKAASMSSLQARRFREQLDLWTLASLMEALRAIEDAQRTMVTSGLPASLVLEALSVKLGCLALGR